MPSASREIRRKRRVKRNLSIMTRLAREEALNRVKVTTVLLSILQQAGGEIEVSQQTFNETVQNLGRVQYTVKKSETEGQFMVRLVTSTESAAEGSSRMTLEPEQPTDDDILTESEEDTTIGNAFTHYEESNPV